MVPEPALPTERSRRSLVRLWLWALVSPTPEEVVEYFLSKQNSGVRIQNEFCTTGG
ncbi:hypothetical protein [Nostoc sp.]|uniref:hypothetical protein n=1 Tax=Nostoc sp. TaxID=1180 RepID=UPI002FFC0C33